MRNHWSVCSGQRSDGQRSGGGQAPVGALVTACPSLVIIPCTRGANAETRFGRGDFCLMHVPSGCQVPACGAPDALAALASRLAWFSEILDPTYLADPAHADMCASLQEILRAWVAEQAEPALPPRSGVGIAMQSRALWDPAS